MWFSKKLCVYIFLLQKDNFYFVSDIFFKLKKGFSITFQEIIASSTVKIKHNANEKYDLDKLLYIKKFTTGI